MNRIHSRRLMVPAAAAQLLAVPVLAALAFSALGLAVGFVAVVSHATTFVLVALSGLRDDWSIWSSAVVWAACAVFAARLMTRRLTGTPFGKALRMGLALVVAWTSIAMPSLPAAWLLGAAGVEWAAFIPTAFAGAAAIAASAVAASPLPEGSSTQVEVAARLLAA